MGRKRNQNPKFQDERDNKAQPIVAKTSGQRIYLKALQNKILVVPTGSAGTGKTFIAAAHAANRLIKGEVESVVLTRPYVSMGRSSGLFPGTVYEKLEPYLKPILNVLKARLGDNDYDSRVRAQRIVIQAMEAIRGMSFENCVLIIDECFPKGTEVLTESGFKDIREVDTSDKVYQINQDMTGEFVTPERIVEKHSESLIEIGSERFKSVTTPNHDVVYIKKNGELYKSKAKDKTFKHHSIPVSSSSKLGGLTLSGLEIAYACAIQADGSLETTLQSNGVEFNYWSVSFSKERKIEYFREILDGLAIKHTEYAKDSRGRVRFYLGQRDPLLVSRTKEKDFDQTAILGLDSEAQISFINELSKWDGSLKAATPLYCSTNYSNIQIAQTLGHLNGYRCRVTTTNDSRDIFKTKPKTNYRLTFVKTSKVGLQNSEKVEVDYNDTAYCVTVPSGMLMVRQGEQVFISGNCQNTTPEEMKSIVTRIGENCQVILCGDPAQTDIKGENGLDFICNIIRKHRVEEAQVIEFYPEDVVRSGITRKFVQIFDKPRGER